MEVQYLHGCEGGGEKVFLEDGGREDGERVFTVYSVSIAGGGNNTCNHFFRAKHQSLFPLRVSKTQRGSRGKKKACCLSCLATGVSLQVECEVIRPGEGAVARLTLEGACARVLPEVSGQLV